MKRKNAMEEEGAVCGFVENDHDYKGVKMVKTDEGNVGGSIMTEGEERSKIYFDEVFGISIENDRDVKVEGSGVSDSLETEGDVKGEVKQEEITSESVSTNGDERKKSKEESFVAFCTADDMTNEVKVEEDVFSESVGTDPEPPSLIVGENNVCGSIAQLGTMVNDVMETESEDGLRTREMKDDPLSGPPDPPCVPLDPIPGPSDPHSGPPNQLSGSNDQPPALPKPQPDLIDDPISVQRGLSPNKQDALCGQQDPLSGPPDPLSGPPDPISGPPDPLSCPPHLLPGPEARRSVPLKPHFDLLRRSISVERDSPSTPPDPLSGPSCCDSTPVGTQENAAETLATHSGPPIPTSVPSNPLSGSSKAQSGRPKALYGPSGSKHKSGEKLNSRSEDPPSAGLLDPTNKCICSINHHHLTKKEIIKIIKAGRPTPDLPDLKGESHQKKRNTFTRRFSTKHYLTYEWLAGCSCKSELYCFPCLLVSTDRTKLWCNGFSDICQFYRAAIRHQKSTFHKNNSIKVLQLVKTTLQKGGNNSDESQAIRNHNEKVARNLQVLKRITAAVVSQSANLELPLQQREGPLHRGNYFKTVHLLAGFDRPIEDHLASAMDFIWTDPTIQTELSQCIAATILDGIKSEMASASFLALSLDQLTDAPMSQLSTVFRYVNTEGLLRERFVGFTDVRNRTADGVLNHVKTMIETYGVQDKLIAQSYSGGVVLPGHLGDLHAKVRQLYPSTLFVQSYDHEIKSVLEKCSMYVTDAKIFFQTLNGLPIFFSTTMTVKLAKFVRLQFPHMCDTGWDFENRLFSLVAQHRVILMNFFDTVVSEGDCSSQEIIAARGYFYFLRDFNTLFFLEMFIGIFGASDKLYKSLKKGDASPVASHLTAISQFSLMLKSLRNDGFQDLWRRLEPMGINDDSLKSKYNRVHDQVMDLLITEISDRFSEENLEQLRFMALADTSLFSTYFMTTSLDTLLKNMKQNVFITTFFDVQELKNDLTVLYGNVTYGFRNKPLKEVVKMMVDDGCKNVFPEAYKLFCLVATIPTVASFPINSSPSIASRIKCHLRNTIGQEPSPDLSVISIEREFLLQMKRRSKTNPYDEIISKFTEKTQRPEFKFKLQTYKDYLNHQAFVASNLELY